MAAPDKVAREREPAIVKIAGFFHGPKRSLTLGVAYFSIRFNAAEFMQ